jgi:hypothetical protein
MPESGLPKSVIIIGAGAAGLFAARRFRQLGVNEITLLEKEKAVGGKCKTYYDPRVPHLKTEYGAHVIAFNYGVVLDALVEKKIHTERLLVSTQNNTLEFSNRLNALGGWKKVKFVFGFLYQIIKFNLAVRTYHRTRDRAKGLPAQFEEPFAVFAKQRRLMDLAIFLKPLVAGFGYGAIDVCPTYSVLDYLGYLTIPFILLGHLWGRVGLIGIQDGFQHFMTEIAQDFTIETGVHIQKIKRDNGPEKITVSYTNNGSNKILSADALVLAISPLHWPELGMTLTPLEEQCVEPKNLDYYRYPVAICRIKGLARHNIFFPNALNEKDFKHVCFITTNDYRENPVDGRLCTVCLNLPLGPNHFSLAEKSPERLALLDDLYKLPEITDVDILDVKIWDDYFSSLPWGLRLALDKAQLHPDTNTLYVGSYILGGFEDVACVANGAHELVDKVFGIKTPFLQKLYRSGKRIIRFFVRPSERPVS